MRSPLLNASHPRLEVRGEVAEGWMPRRNAGTPRRREVRTMFEPSRIAERCLTDAYARVVPVVRRCVAVTPATAGAEAAPDGRHQGVR